MAGLTLPLKEKKETYFMATEEILHSIPSGKTAFIDSLQL